LRTGDGRSDEVVEGHGVELAEPLHHGSHLDLLESVPLNAVPPVNGAPAELIGAIVVPTFRPARHLDHARELAADLGCRLVALCSGQAKAAEVIARSPRHAALTYAIDIPSPRTPALDSFETTRLGSVALGADQRDTALKRNLGLLLARSMGWDRIVFMDDDIIVDDPYDVARAAALTSRFDVVGQAVTGFPDNSVVCHARRDVGEYQKTFIGGGAMALRPALIDSFFPEVYNEDWLFLFDQDQLLTVASAGQVTQEEYDPYADPGRAGREEFGDCLAEGIYSRLDQKRASGQHPQLTDRDVDEAFWRAFLDDRRLVIDSIIERVPAIPADADRKVQMLRSLDAARDRLGTIRPAEYVDYLAAWKADREVWAGRLAKCPHATDEDDVADMVVALGIPRESVYQTGATPLRDGHPTPAGPAPRIRPAEQRQANGESVSVTGYELAAPVAQPSQPPER
jgi:hypothetical protein